MTRVGYEEFTDGEVIGERDEHDVIELSQQQRDVAAEKVSVLDLNDPRCADAYHRLLTSAVHLDS